MRFPPLRLAALVLAGVVSCLAAPRRPNVLVILTDDQGYADTSMNGATDVRTPEMDRLAAEGTRFTAMRANATVCSPTRAALLTGKYPDRVGVPGVIRTKPEDSWGYLDPAVPTLATLLHGAGYHTALVGKWHLGLTAPNLPNLRGFDHFHGFLGDMMDSYTTHLREGRNYLRRNGEVIEAEGHATNLFTDWALDYLRSRVGQPQPFFLYLAYNAPHSPVEPPAEDLARVRQRDPGLDPKRAAAVALVEHLDAQLGRVLAFLRESGLERDTAVFLTSDNGGSLPHGARNTPWRDGKQSHYDGGLRVPFAVRWPGVTKPGSSCDVPGLTFDIFPTALEAAGVPRPADCDAVSLQPALRGEAAPQEPREMYFVRREGGPAYGGKSYEAIIRGPWKLLQNSPYSALELYHLGDDPGEQHNLVREKPQIARELQAALRRHLQRGGAVPWQR